ncbi:MAG: hypothetical protein IKS59_05970, partial [Aeriscardovia sp.]|nr:hypothetical protein [Aeriscardovia sp.]
DTPTAVQKYLYRCFRQHFKNLTYIKTSYHKIRIYWSFVLDLIACNTGFLTPCAHDDPYQFITSEVI